MSKLGSVASGTFLLEESFDTLAAVNNNQTYRHGRSVHCAHELRDDAFDVHGSAHGRGFRIVAAPGYREGCGGDAGACEIRSHEYLANHSNLLGFSSFYVDTRGASTLEPFHHIGQGAFFGVEKVDTGAQAFALRAEGVKGLIAVCSKPVVVSADAVEASAKIYVAQGGWDSADDELRVWADLGGADPAGGAVSLLPNCTALATPQNVDLLGLRSASNSSGGSSPGPPLSEVRPFWPRGNLWRDAAWGVVKGRLAHDTWAWRELSASLGHVEGSEVRVCVGLQSGGTGATAVFVDHLQLSAGGSVRGAAGPVLRGGGPVCEPSAQLVRISSLASLAVPGSCGLAVNRTALVVLAALVALIAVFKLVAKLWDVRPEAQERRQMAFAGLEVANPPRPLA